MQTAAESFQIAQNHLERVKTSWDDPVDWGILAPYGFYCLEACVVAVALHLGLPRPSSHPKKVQEARQFASVHGLPDVGDLLIDLNNMRKHEAYGDIDPPENLDPQDVATEIDEYVEAVNRLLTP